MTRLYLASASPARARMLQAAGLSFSTRAANIDEDAIKNSFGESVDPDTVARMLAREKALAVSKDVPGALVLGADQVLEFAGKRYDKAVDKETARIHLRKFSGKSHRLISAAALVQDGAVLWKFSRQTELTMRQLDQNTIDHYLDITGPTVLEAVGVYHLEGIGAQLFSNVDGDYFTVLGLPLLQVLEALRRFGPVTGLLEASEADDEPPPGG